MPGLLKKYFLIGALLIISSLVISASDTFSQGNERIKLKNPTAKELNRLCAEQTLEKLILKGQLEGKIPKCLGDIKTLSELELNEVNSNLDFSSISRIRSLKILRIKHFEINQLPDFVIDMSSLRFIDISGTEIKSLPDGLDFIEKIDMRMIDLNREQQESLRQQYPNMEILFSSPCQCG